MKQDKQYRIKGDKSGRLYTAEPNLTETMKLNVIIFNLLSVETNDVDGNHKYYANNVRYDQIEEVKQEDTGITYPPVREQFNSAPSRVVNPDYTHFVVNKMTGVIVSGWEYKEDAVDSMNEFNDDVNARVDALEFNQSYSKKMYKVCTANQYHGMAFDSAYWGNR